MNKVKFNLLIIAFLTLTGLSFISIESKTNSFKKITIEWTEKIEGDFSFKENWSYPEGVYKNEFGQLSCDGICPVGVDQMKDENGKIYQDSLEAFYQLVDTLHIFHSIKSEAWTYEWAGTDFINFTRQSDNSIRGQSACNVATHSSLNIEINNNYCSAWVDFNSITDIGKQIFPLESGTIRIDKILFKKRIIKAEFYLNFSNTIDEKKKIFWKGQIYSEIKK